MEKSAGGVNPGIDKETTGDRDEDVESDSRRTGGLEESKERICQKQIRNNRYWAETEVKQAEMVKTSNQGRGEESSKGDKGDYNCEKGNQGGVDQRIHGSAR